MNSSARLAGVALATSIAAMAAGCASSGKQAKAAQAPPAIVDVTAPVIAAQKDALGNYRFEMQQGQTRMTADQFDAWMKANGIRVARGNAKGAATE